MASDMYLKIGDIDGESRRATHEQWIDVLAWSWGAAAIAGARTGRRADASRPEVQDLVLTKWVDSASTELLRNLFTGRNESAATLEVVRAGSEKATSYLKIVLSDVVVSSVSTGGSGGEDRLTENVTLNFAKVEFTYTGQSDDGGEGRPESVSYDVARNVTQADTHNDGGAR